MIISYWRLNLVVPITPFLVSVTFATDFFFPQESFHALWQRLWNQRTLNETLTLSANLKDALIWNLFTQFYIVDSTIKIQMWF
jgi:hypothetical protein